MNTEELRRLAEQANSEPWEWSGKFHNAANPAAILSLLDELELADRALSQNARVKAAAEQRVAALEAQLNASMEGLRQALDEACVSSLDDDPTCVPWHNTAKGLLQASVQAQATPSGNASEGTP